MYLALDTNWLTHYISTNTLQMLFSVVFSSKPPVNRLKGINTNFLNRYFAMFFLTRCNSTAIYTHFTQYSNLIYRFFLLRNKKQNENNRKYTHAGSAI